MPCYRVKMADGVVALVHCRGRGLPQPCSTCGAMSGYQCDWKLGAGKTCDRHICGDHAKEVAPNKHLCPAHQKEYYRWLSSRVGNEPGAEARA